MSTGEIREFVKELTRMVREAADKTADDKGHKEPEAERVAKSWEQLDRVLNPE